MEPRRLSAERWRSDIASPASPVRWMSTRRQRGPRAPERMTATLITTKNAISRPIKVDRTEPRREIKSVNELTTMARLRRVTAGCRLAVARIRPTRNTGPPSMILAYGGLRRTAGSRSLLPIPGPRDGLTSISGIGVAMADAAMAGVIARPVPILRLLRGIDAMHFDKPIGRATQSCAQLMGTADAHPH